MKRLFIASVILFLPALASAQEKPPINIYDKNRDGKLDRFEYAVLMKHERNPILAKCDKNLSGYIDTPAEQACQNAELDESVRYDLVDAGSAYPQGIPLEEAKSYSGYQKPKPKPLLPDGMFIRDAYNAGPVVSVAALERQKLVGARFSYANYLDTDQYAFNGSGALVYQKIWRFEAPKELPLGTPRIWAFGLAPSLEFNRTKTNRTGGRDTNYLGAFLSAEIATEDMPIFSNQFFRVAGYQKTDFDGIADVPGVFAEWQPLHPALSIGVTKQLPGTNLRYFFGPVFRVEAERVNDRGILSTQLARGDFTRAGAILQSKIFFADGPLQPFSLNTKYWMLTDISSNPAGTDRRYFQSNLLYNLDDNGHFAIDFMYRKGDEPGLAQRVNDFTIGLSAKY
jgi:hypothetical protein